MNKPIRFLKDQVEKRPFLVDKIRSFVGKDWVNNAALYEQFCLWRAHRLNEKRPFGTLRLNIETTSACNAQCVFCSRNSFPLPRRNMEQSIYEKIIREARELGVREVILSVYGEPLLDARFLQRCRLADEAGLDISFFTNGSLLKDQVSHSLMGLKRLRAVNFSINALSPELYQEIMIGLPRDAVFANVRRFLEMKKLYRNDIQVTISYVIFNKSIKEKNAFFAYFSKVPGVDKIYFPAIRNRGGTPLDVDLRGEAVVFSPLSKMGHRLLPCKFLWEDLFVYWDGTVGVCCEDSAARRIIVGDLKQQSLAEVWMGIKIQELRGLHLRGRRRLHPICGGACTYNTAWFKPSD
jgi:MoaA/NifB/PqqE/SkfB family radical SAM enzyme